MRQSVNYIEHQRAVYFKMSEDVNLTPIHISLYMALFMIWNECGFDTELSINRNDIMKLAKIGSANTYITALKELTQYGYIIYNPSFNPLVGSKVTIITFDKGSNKGTGTGSVKGGSKGSDTLYKQVNNKTKKQRNKVSHEVKKLRADCKEKFLSIYTDKTGTDYYWTAKDAVNLIQLISKVEFKVKEKFETSTHEKVLAGFSVLLLAITDSWLLSNFSIPNINSKFNEIFTQIKSQQNGTAKVEKGHSVFN